MIRLLLVLAFVLCQFSPKLDAQASKDLLKEANELYEAGKYNSAIPLFREILMKDNILDAKLGLANCHRMLKNYEEAEYWYELVLPLRPNNPELKLQLAKIEQSNEKYEEAKKHFLDYAKVDASAQQFADACDRVDEFKKDSDRYQVQMVPFSTTGTDFGPMFSPKGILFCSARKPQKPGSMQAADPQGKYTDLYYTEKVPGNAYAKPMRLKGKVNSLLNDGPASFSNDASQLLFTRNTAIKNKDKTVHRLQIYFSELKGENSWDKPVPFIYNNAKYNTGHPMLSPDNTLLFFVSDMEGGYGGTDLYFCERIDTFWSEPLNLGPKVNTAGDELFPFFHPDGTLYYASDGLPGLGGLDVFATKLEAGGSWTEPKNIGAPLNSARDDFSFIINEENSAGYFASNRKGGLGDDDIYYFKLKDYNVTKAKSGYPFKKRAPKKVLTPEQKKKAKQKERQLALAKKKAAAAKKAKTNPKTAKVKKPTTKPQKPAKASKTKKPKKKKSNRPIKTQKPKKEELANENQSTILLPESQKNKEPETDKPSSTSTSENTKTEIIEKAEKTEKPSPKGSNITYKVHIGPYPSAEINQSEMERFKDLGGEIEYTDDPIKGTSVIVGTFEAISISEYAQTFIKGKGYKKAKVIVYIGGVPTDIKLKTLKKQGLK